MKIFRILLGVIGTICLVWTMLFGGSYVLRKQEPLTKVEYKGILTIWHVDTFEGGEGSRKHFLIKVARRLEKQHQGLLISVIDYTPTGVKEQFNKGVYPDILSFGNGVDLKNVKELTISTKFSAGEINGRQYSIPWCRGGYVLISKATNNISLGGQSVDKLIVSQGEYTLPLGALNIEGISVNEFSIKSPLDAYVDFVASKDSVLLGTQRDVVRLRNRGIEIKTRSLTKFCDLYQNIALLTSDNQKIEYCDKFINILLSESVQKELRDISMFSVDYNVDFQDEHLCSMQRTSPVKTISSFMEANALKNLQTVLIDATKGDKTADIKFKNLLI